MNGGKDKKEKNKVGILDRAYLAKTIKRSERRVERSDNNPDNSHTEIRIEVAKAK